MRVPISGGAPEMVLEGGLIDLLYEMFPVFLRPSCVLGEGSPDRKQCFCFPGLDAMKGAGLFLARVIETDPVGECFWDLTRDGSHLAYFQDFTNARAKERHIQILPLSGGEAREVVIKREIQMTSLDWANDGKGFFVGAGGLVGLLLFVDLDGRTDILWKRETLYGLGPRRGLTSPDGRHLAISGWTVDNNAWMLENF